MKTMYENVSLVIVLISDYVRRNTFYVDATLVAYNIMFVFIIILPKRSTVVRIYF